MDDLLVAGANLLLNVNKPNYNVSPGKGSPASSNHIVRSLAPDDDYYYKRNEGSAPCNATNNCVRVSSICSPVNQKGESFDVILPPFHRLARLESHFANKQEKGKPRPGPATLSNNSRERTASSGSGSDSPDSFEAHKIGRKESLSISLKNKKAILSSKKRDGEDRNARNSNVRSSSSDANMTDSPAASASADSNSASNTNQKPNTKKRRSPQSDMDKELLAKFRKESHSALEQRRRDKINDGINQLKELVEPFHNGKYDKASVLRKSIEYIQQAQALQRRLVEENYALRDDNGQLSACLDVVRTQNRLLRLEMTKLRPDLQQHLAEEDESIAQLCAACTYKDHVASKNAYAGTMAAIDNKAAHHNEHYKDVPPKGLYDRDRNALHSSESSKQCDPRQSYDRYGADREQDALKSLYWSYCSEKRQTMCLPERDRDLNQRYERHEHNKYYSSHSPSPFAADRDVKPMYALDRDVGNMDSHACNKLCSDNMFLDYSKPAYAESSSQHSTSFEREPLTPSNAKSNFSSASASGSSSSSSESVYGLQLLKHSSSSSSSSSSSGAAGAAAASSGGSCSGSGCASAQGQGAVSVSVCGSGSEKKSVQVQGSPREGSSNKASYGVQVQVQMPDVNPSNNNHYLSLGTDISINISSASASSSSSSSSSSPDNTSDQNQTQIHHFSESQRISKRTTHDDEGDPNSRFVHNATPSSTV